MADDTDGWETTDQVLAEQGETENKLWQYCPIADVYLQDYE